MKRQTSCRAPLQLFCFPYAGGGASIYRPWQCELGPSIQIEPIRLPGREARLLEPPLRSVPELCEAIAREIVQAIHGPFVFFGYSFGALLAFETARVLRRQHICPERLMVAALKAPQLVLRRKPIHNLEDDEFVDEIRSLRGTPDAVLQNPELMNLVLPAIRADFTAYETYRYSAQPPLDCPISAMGGATDPSVSMAELAAWGEQTSATFRTHVFPGDHFFLHSVRPLLTWTVLQELLPMARCA